MDNYLEYIVNDTNYDFLFDFNYDGEFTKRFKENLILLTVAGSHAYGLNTCDSDVDIRGIMMEPENVIYGLHSFETITDTKTDTVIHGFNKFCALAAKCNPNILDLLYCDLEEVLYITKEGKELRKHRDIFLSKRITSTTLGCVKGNKNRIQKAIENGDIKKANKYIMHCIRLLLSAVECHKTGHYVVKQDTKELLKIRDSKDIVFFGHWESIINTLEVYLKEIHDKQSVLPDEADITAIEDLMIKIYKGE